MSGFGRAASLALVATALVTIASVAFGQDDATLKKTGAEKDVGVTETQTATIVVREATGQAVKDATDQENVAVVVTVKGQADGEADGEAEDSAFWLGVSGEAAGGALLAQLKIDAAVVVQEVVENSPAAKAGLKQHDLIVRCGEAGIGKIEDLTYAIAKSEGKEIELVVIRGGEKLVVKVQPEKRPEGLKLKHALLDPAGRQEPYRDLSIWLEDAKKGEAGALGLYTLRPGMVFGKAEVDASLPGNTTITMRKGDGPTQIEVTHDGKTYKVTEDKLGELPENLRAPIERMLKGTGQMYGFHRILPGLPEKVQKELKLRFETSDSKEGAKEGVKVESKEVEGKKSAEGRQTKIISPHFRVESTKKKVESEVKDEVNKALEARLEQLLRKMEKIEKDLSDLKEKRE